MTKVFRHEPSDSAFAARQGDPVRSLSRAHSEPAAAGAACDLLALSAADDAAAGTDVDRGAESGGREQVDLFLSLKNFALDHPAPPRNGKPCSICALPEAPIINRAIRDGQSVTLIARWLLAPVHQGGRGYKDTTRDRLYHHKKSFHHLPAKETPR
jgi:hypothetical protein